MVVEIEDAGQMAELMYALTWFAGTEPKGSLRNNFLTS